MSSEDKMCFFFGSLPAADKRVYRAVGLVRSMRRFYERIALPEAAIDSLEVKEVAGCLEVIEVLLTELYCKVPWPLELIEELLSEVSFCDERMKEVTKKYGTVYQMV